MTIEHVHTRAGDSLNCSGCGESMPAAPDVIIFGVKLSFRCFKCNAELPVGEIWMDDTGLSMTPGDWFLESCRRAFVKHNADDKCGKEVTWAT